MKELKLIHILGTIIVGVGLLMTGLFYSQVYKYVVGDKVDATVIDVRYEGTTLDISKWSYRADDLYYLLDNGDQYKVESSNAVGLTPGDRVEVVVDSEGQIIEPLKNVLLGPLAQLVLFLHLGTIVYVLRKRRRKNMPDLSSGV